MRDNKNYILEKIEYSVTPKSIEEIDIAGDLHSGCGEYGCSLDIDGRIIYAIHLCDKCNRQFVVPMFYRSNFCKEAKSKEKSLEGFNAADIIFYEKEEPERLYERYRNLSYAFYIASNSRIVCPICGSHEFKRLDGLYRPQK